MTHALLFAAILLSPSGALAQQSPDQGQATDPWLRPPAAAPRVAESSPDDAVWDGDWRDLRLVSTLVFASDAIAVLGTPTGELLPVRVGSHVGARYETVYAINTTQVKLLVETDQPRDPWCALSIELRPRTWDLEADRPSGLRLETRRRVLRCAPTAGQATAEEDELAPES